MADQRRYPRVPVTRSVRIEIGSGAVVQARMVNISQEGVALRYEAPAEVGARLELNFSLIVRGRMVEYCVACVARYKHLSSHGDVIGPQFVELEQTAGEHLRNFIAHKTQHVRRLMKKSQPC